MKKKHMKESRWKQSPGLKAGDWCVLRKIKPSHFIIHTAHTSKISSQACKEYTPKATNVHACRHTHINIAPVAKDSQNAHAEPNAAFILHRWYGRYADLRVLRLDKAAAPACCAVALEVRKLKHLPGSFLQCADCFCHFEWGKKDLLFFTEIFGT